MKLQANRNQSSSTTDRRAFLKGLAGSVTALSVIPAQGVIGSKNEFLHIATTVFSLMLLTSLFGG